MKTSKKNQLVDKWENIQPVRNEEKANPEVPVDRRPSFERNETNNSGTHLLSSSLSLPKRRVGALASVSVAMEKHLIKKDLSFRVRVWNTFRSVEFVTI